MDNITQFSIYTAKIFEELYASFPVPKFIDQEKMISIYLSFDKDDEISKEKEFVAAVELVKIFHEMDPDNVTTSHDYDERKVKSENKIMELNYEKRIDRDNQIEIFTGTLDFLISEGLILKIDRKGYRLTSRSFSHLNKTFEEGKVREEDRSYIFAIKNMFDQTKSISKEVAVGTAIAIIPKLLGYN
ncbi:hypothetical protein M2366_002992 [Aeromonas sp. BIGb0405]|uniref:hypothetical protein n=1 Tax=Aeromonas TaxID=642 RepID=UPI00216A66A0|nr:hypothetical protein [Aeromonas sp. BIGb0405]MCS3456886.1 hypothetical protein [Aeromonas sp. BIGb0405]